MVNTEYVLLAVLVLGFYVAIVAVVAVTNGTGARTMVAEKAISRPMTVEAL